MYKIYDSEIVKNATVFGRMRQKKGRKNPRQTTWQESVMMFIRT